jgi:autophagy-related protein 9
VRDSSTRQPVAGTSSGGAATDDSNLGDSWRMNPLARDEEGTGEAAEGENIDAIAGGAGVLGLIQQFQKANTEGRRTTMGI